MTQEKGPDMVTAFVDLAVKVGNLDDQAAKTLERELVSRWGGKAFRVRTRLQTISYARDIEPRLRQGMTVTRIAEHFGVTRCTIYRHLPYSQCHINAKKRG